MNQYQINKEIEKSNLKMIEDYIIHANNQLHALSYSLGINIEGLNFISKETNENIKSLENDGFGKQSSKSFEEDEMRALLAGIKNSSNDSELNNRLRAAKQEVSQDEAEEESDGGYVAPPRTQPVDWNRISLSEFEKNRIIHDIKKSRNNPNKVIATDKPAEFTWNPKEFLSAFNFLESDKYNGPLLMTLIDNTVLLKRLSEQPGLESCIQKIQKGRYVMLSVYDIQARNISEPKNMYLGLNYNTRTGGITFDALGPSIGSAKTFVSKNQKRQVVEYLKEFGINYNEHHKDLN